MSKRVCQAVAFHTSVFKLCKKTDVRTGVPSVPTLNGTLKSYIFHLHIVNVYILYFNLYIMNPPVGHHLSYAIMTSVITWIPNTLRKRREMWGPMYWGRVLLRQRLLFGPGSGLWHGRTVQWRLRREELRALWVPKMQTRLCFLNVWAWLFIWS